MSQPTLTPALHERRERVFLILAGIFLGAMAMLNIIGITRFIQLGPLQLAVGVLPYPLTFICTDLICELYGKRRANYLVFVGLIVNLLVIGTIWLGQAVPAVGPEAQPPWQFLPLNEPVPMPNGASLGEDGTPVELFDILYACTAGAVLASMCAYLAAQFCDVALFHFWKKLTKGKHLWLRNNGSTLVSQLVDTTMVIVITFGAGYSRGEITLSTMLTLIGSGYLFKMTVALLDTGPLYVLVHYLGKYLQIDPIQEHNIDVEEASAAG
ncbi:MAG: queuosine precursor transporter [Acidobacteriota bacterium]|nr:queuosine precursor transporter [Acidobacteriota bacterium]